MERSAVYRRALAPVMIFAGALGVVAAIAGIFFHLDSMRTFGALWLGTAVVAVAGAFLIARRQAIEGQGGVFWSPPTRRMAQALSPPLTCRNRFIALHSYLLGTTDEIFTEWLAFFWILFYGCAIHAAGFFMPPHGMKWFGWLFILFASLILFLMAIVVPPINDFSAHWLMGFFFGVLHLAYGVYLYLTEKKNSIA